MGKFPTLPTKFLRLVRCVGSNLDIGGQIVNMKSLNTNHVMFYTLGKAGLLMVFYTLGEDSQNASLRSVRLDFQDYLAIAR